MQLFAVSFFMQKHGATDGPLKYGPVVVPLNDGMTDIEHMKDNKHTQLLYLIHIVVSTNQQVWCRVPRRQILVRK